MRFSLSFDTYNEIDKLLKRGESHANIKARTGVAGSAISLVRDSKSYGDYVANHTMLYKTPSNKSFTKLEKEDLIRLLRQLMNEVDVQGRLYRKELARSKKEITTLRREVLALDRDRLLR